MLVVEGGDANAHRQVEPGLVDDEGTCHLVAWDDHGRIALVTTSVGGMFGSKIATAGGFFLGEALTDFAHDAHGAKVATRGPNFPRAGARPASSMAPTLVLRDGRPILAIGGSGGGRIPTSILQVLHRALSPGVSLADAVNAPRFHTPAAGGLQIERELEAVADDLRARGEALDDPEPSFAAVSALRLHPEGSTTRVEVAPDPRKDGHARIWRTPQEIP